MNCRFYLALAFLSLLFFVNFAQSDDSRIKKIEVQSPNSDFNSWTESSLNRFIDKPFLSNTSSEIRDLLQPQWSKGNYYATQIESTQLRYDQTLIIKVQNPVRYEIQMNGVSPLLMSDLNTYLALNKFSTTNPNFHYEISQKIKSFYLDLGYSRVDTRVTVNVARGYQQTVIFDVSEGPRVRINSIRFIGQFSMPSQFYEEQFLKVAPKLIKSGYFNRKMIDSAISNMKTNLWNTGYLKAQASINRIALSKDRSRVDIFILLFEGEQTFLKNVDFVGNSNLSSSELLEVLEINLNTPLALSDLETKSQKLVSHYLDQGYLQMRLLNFGPQMVQYSDDFTQAKLVFEIQEGPQIKVTSIVLEGHDLTKDYVIRNELEFKSGDTLTRIRVKDSKERLYLTGLFRDVEITIEPEISDQPDRVVRVKVFEREPGLLNAGFGAHNERGLTLRGFAGTSYNNLMGTARALSARIEGQYNLVNLPFFERSIQAFYLEPYLLNSRTRGRIGISRSFLITDFNNDVASEANRTNYTIEQNITPRLLARWQIYEITTFRDFAIRSNFETNKVDIGSSMLSLEWDHRDHPFNPTSGFLTSGLIEYADPNLLSSEWVQFYKTQFNWTQYQRLFDSNWVIAVSGRFGQLWNDPQGQYAIPYDKVGFFLGGQVNLRGFTLNEIFPNTLDLGGNNYRLTGSAQMRLIKTELRIPIWDSVGTALFYDMGDIRFSNNLYDSTWRRSAGIAFRYNTPVGAVSLEYAWKLPALASRRESPATLHFAIGTF